MLNTTAPLHIGVVFGDTDPYGIYTPKNVLFGSASGGNGKPLVLDLKANELDARITYTGPAHYYWDASGNLTLSAENEWPLEYINGEVVGRHEPEPASTNIITSTSLDNLTYEVSGNVTRYRETTAYNYHRLQIRDSLNNQTQSVQIVYTPVNKTYFYFRAPITSASQNTNIGVDDTAIGYKGSGYQSASVKTNGNSIRILQIVFADKASSDGFLTSDRAVSSDALVTFSGRTTAGFDLYSIQSESGEKSTSPMTSDKSRTASSVTVDMKNYTTLTISYSDGSSNTVTPDSSSYTLPLAEYSWAYRYVTQLTLSN